MTRRVLVIEPDPSGRVVVQRALGGAGYAVATAASLAEARGLLDGGQVRLAVVDESAGGGQALEDVRRLRSFYPRVPALVTGTLLSQRVLLALMRLGVAGALLKPFAPEELLEAIEAALSGREGDEGVEYEAAVALSRHALGRGRPGEARAALARARAVAPLEAEVVALAALAEELEGNDAAASRGFRAAMVLGEGEAWEGPDPRAGLSRLDAYGQARPVERLRESFKGAPLWVAGEGEAAGPPPGAGPLVAALGLGLEGDAVYLREGPGRLAFALLASVTTSSLDELTRLNDLGPRAGPVRGHERPGEASGAAEVEGGAAIAGGVAS